MDGLKNMLAKTTLFKFTMRSDLSAHVYLYSASKTNDCIYKTKKILR